jgi:hypothetical protein
VRKPEFGHALLSDDLKDDVSAVPFGSVFDKVNVAVHDMPYHLLARQPFSNPLSGVIKALVAVRELSTELVGTAVNFSRPPPTNVVDGRRRLLQEIDRP